MIEYLRAVPEGESVSNSLESYIDDKGMGIDKSQIETAARIFIENKALDNVAIKEKC